MTRIEKQRLAKIRKEFAELKGAGCISVLMSFDDYLSWMDNINDEPEVDSESLKKFQKDQDPIQINLKFNKLKNKRYENQKRNISKLSTRPL